MENQKAYMSWLSGVLGKAEGEPEQWYSVSQKEFHSNYGRGLLAHYHGSPYQLLSTLYPDQNWLPWRFTRAPKDFWTIKANQRKYLDWLAVKLGYRNKEDWYKVTRKDFQENYGDTLLRMFETSPYRLLRAVFEEDKFLPWMFNTTPNDVWRDLDTMRMMILYVEEELNLKTVDDWTRVTGSQLRDLGVDNAFLQRGGSAKVIAETYPDANTPLLRYKKKEEKEKDKEKETENAKAQD